MTLLRLVSRSSCLAKAQVAEFVLETDAKVEPFFIESTGDLDKKTSLRGLEKSDFFTKELDAWVLEEKADLALHSAKDLAEPLPKGLVCLWMSQGIDSRDALVVRDLIAFKKIEEPKVATSSERREEAVRKVVPSACFQDLRGTILERLSFLERGVDGIVVAEAALIRLKLTHLPRLYLPGTTASLQGKLAIIAKEGRYATLPWARST